MEDIRILTTPEACLKQLKALQLAADLKETAEQTTERETNAQFAYEASPAGVKNWEDIKKCGEIYVPKNEDGTRPNFRDPLDRKHITMLFHEEALRGQFPWRGRLKCIWEADKARVHAAWNALQRKTGLVPPGIQSNTESIPLQNLDKKPKETAKPTEQKRPAKTADDIDRELEEYYAETEEVTEEVTVKRRGTVKRISAQAAQRRQSRQRDPPLRTLADYADATNEEVIHARKKDNRKRRDRERMEFEKYQDDLSWNVYDQNGFEGGESER